MTLLHQKTYLNIPLNSLIHLVDPTNTPLPFPSGAATGL